MSALSCYTSNSDSKKSCSLGNNNDNNNGCTCGAVNKCFSGCNNIHFKCPALMADGRLWASWQPEAVVNNRIQTEQGIQTNWDYRNYIQHNGLRIMNFNTLENCYLVGLECNKDTRKNMEYSKNTPFLFSSVADTRRPAVGYCDSDLKNPYISREQLNARLIAPYIIPPKQPIV